MVHPTPQMSQPARVAPGNWSKVRLRPRLVTVKRVGRHVGRADRSKRP
jgi:hypothetical protein